METLNQFTPCGGCIHQVYCPGAYRKTTWCGNHTVHSRRVVFPKKEIITDKLKKEKGKVMEDNKKSISWLQEFGKLFPDHTDRKLKDNHRWCDKCNGLGFIRSGDYIRVCTTCSGAGMIELCATGCGKDRARYYNMCEACYEEYQNKARVDRETSRYEKAEKINYSDYDGAFLVDGCDTVMDKSDFEEWIYDKIYDNEEDIPKYVYASKKYRNIDIDIYDVVSNACEDGYEEQFEHLDAKTLEPIQELLNKWIEAQGEAAYVYNEDYSRVIILDDIIQEIRDEIEKRRTQ